MTAPKPVSPLAEQFAAAVLAHLHPPRIQTTAERYAAIFSDALIEQYAKHSPGQIGLFGNGLGGSQLRSSKTQQRIPWDEAKHPRDEEGKFTEKDHGTAGAGKKPKTPSVYPSGETQVMGADGKGKAKPTYTAKGNEVHDEKGKRVAVTLSEEKAKATAAKWSEHGRPEDPVEKERQKAIAERRSSGIQPAKALKNSEAKSGDQLGLLGEATRKPQKKPEFGKGAVKQGTLIDGLDAKLGQMSLIDEAGAPDDMVYQPSNGKGSPEADYKALPSQVAAKVKIHLGKLADIAQAWQQGHALDKAYGGNRYRWEIARKFHPSHIDDHLGQIDKIRQVAARNGIDLDSAVQHVGGLPDGLDAINQQLKEAHAEPDRFTAMHAEADHWLAVAEHYRASNSPRKSAANGAGRELVKGEHGDVGYFVTIDGHPVFVEAESGTIRRGPKHLRDQHIKAVPGKKLRRSRRIQPDRSGDRNSPGQKGMFGDGLGGELLRDPKTQPKLSLAGDSATKAYTQSSAPAKFVPKTRLDRVILEEIGDDPEDVEAFRDMMGDAHKMIVTAAHEINDDLRNLLANFGYSGRRTSQIIQTVRRTGNKGGDHDQIARFDEMADMARRSYPRLLSGPIGESVGYGDDEHALMERLKQGFETVPSRTDARVVSLAREIWDRYTDYTPPDDIVTADDWGDVWDEDPVPFAAAFAASFIEQYMACTAA